MAERRIFFLLIAACALFFLTSCGRGLDGSNSGIANNPTTTGGAASGSSGGSSGSSGAQPGSGTSAGTAGSASNPGTSSSSAPGGSSGAASGTGNQSGSSGGGTGGSGSGNGNAGASSGPPGFTQKTFPAQAAASMAVADVNQDGNPDLILFGYSPAPSVMLNDGAGNFSSPMPVALPDSYTNSSALALGDFNGDGFPDFALCVGVSGSSMSAAAIYLNDHNGHFTLSQTLPAPNGCSGIAVIDANRDGKLDVAIAFGNVSGSWTNPIVNNGISTWFGNGNGQFANPVTQSGIAVPRSDGSDNPCVLTFADSVASGASQMPELILFGSCEGSTVGNFGDIYIARGDGTGHFSLKELTDTLGIPLHSPEIKDINSNGTSDVLFLTDTQGPHASWSDTLNFLANDGQGNFRLVTGDSESGYGGNGTQINSGTFADLNGDGIPDAIEGFMTMGILPGPSQAGIAIFAGKSDGTFKQSESWVLFQAGTYDIPGSISAIVSADFDHNGKPDIAALTIDGNGQPKLYVYLNQGQ